jgi:hypothetical protein
LHSQHRTPPPAPTWLCKTADYVAIDVDVVKSNLENYVNGDMSGCANPPNLNEMAFIDTAASCTPLTTMSPATTLTNADIQITIIQPGGACMTTTHAVNLLLQTYLLMHDWDTASLALSIIYSPLQPW